MRNHSVLAALAVTLVAVPAGASTIYAGVAWQTSRELGGLSQQPQGGLVTVDLGALGPASIPTGASSTPGGTTLVADVFDPPPPIRTRDGYLQGLEYADGRLFAASFECADEFCTEGPSRLLEIDPATGAALEIGLIRDGAQSLNIYDLAMNPGNGVLYGITSFHGSSCYGCLYTIDRATAAATLVGQAFTEFQSIPGGLTFGLDGTLYATTTFPLTGIGPNGNRNPLDFLTLDPATGQILSREDLLLEQQFRVVRGGVSNLIRSAPLQGLVTTPDGRILATGDNGNTKLYERIFGQVLDPSGVPIGSPRFVWRLLGDSGENLADLAVVPEPGVGSCLALGALLLTAARAANPRRMSR